MRDSGLGQRTVEGKALAAAQTGEVEWVEADELWAYVGQKNGLLAVVGC